MSAGIASGVLAISLALAAGAAKPVACNTPQACLAALADAQDGRVRAALEGMPDTGTKLLALRSYLRAGDSLGARWSWTQSQIEAFAGSQHEQALDAAIASVRHAFEQENPGFTLSVRPGVRSLNRQLQAWNTNRSVTAAAREFDSAAQVVLHAAALTPQAFANFVKGHKPMPTPTLAAPGLSRHGQMYAVDFHVRRGNSEVADADSATIEGVWMAQGWEGRLRSAVTASGAPFVGPLQDPHEPWHYDYGPSGGALDPPHHR